MKKTQPRPAITETTLSLQDAVRLWLDDEAAYNDEAAHKNSLVDHITKYCS